MEILKCALIAAAAALLVSCDLVRDSEPLSPGVSPMAVHSVIYAGRPSLVVVGKGAGIDNSALAMTQVILLQGSEVLPVTRSVCTDTAFIVGTYACFSGAFADPLRAGDTVTLQIQHVDGGAEGGTVVPVPVLITSPLSGVTFSPAADALARFTMTIAQLDPTLQNELRIDSVVVRETDGSVRTDCDVFSDPVHRQRITTAEVDVVWQFVNCRRPIGAWTELSARISIVTFNPTYTLYRSYASEGVIREPWPSFGLSGEAIGLFSAASESNVVRITIARPPSGQAARGDANLNSFSR